MDPMESNNKQQEYSDEDLRAILGMMVESNIRYSQGEKTVPHYNINWEAFRNILPADSLLLSNLQFSARPIFRSRHVCKKALDDESINGTLFT